MDEEEEDEEEEEEENEKDTRQAACRISDKRTRASASRATRKKIALQSRWWPTT